jgi:predicted TIM-barrel fold metal-dependent hydrolase
MRAQLSPIIDVDVHNRPKHETDLVEYLPDRWKTFARNRGVASLTPPGPTWAGLAADSGRRSDLIDEHSVLPGYSYDLVVRDLFEPYDYQKCILTHDVGQWPAHLNQYFVREICQAANRWMAEEWLARDGRFAAQIVVPWAEPLEAASEIRRVGKDDRMVGVLFAANPLARPLGDPVYHPVLEAAAELGLVITVHPSGVDRPLATMTGAGGSFTSTIESSSLLSQQAMHYVASLVTHGVFEKYPDLRVLVLEYGVAWLPSILWRLDEEYERMRMESPWVKRYPSAYVREHIKFGTQPLEESSSDTVSVIDLLGTVEGIEDLLCFATDYPHWSMDEPSYMARVLPESWHRKIFYENARNFYRWDLPDAHALRPTAGTGAQAP